MDKKLIFLVSFFFLVFSIFASAVIFEKPLSNLINAREEPGASGSESLMFAWPLSTKSNTTPVTITVFVRNTEGKPLANKLVSTTSTFGTINPPAGVSDADGKVVFQLTSGQPGAAEVTATVDNQPLTQKVSVKFD